MYLHFHSKIILLSPSLDEKAELKSISFESILFKPASCRKQLFQNELSSHVLFQFFLPLLTFMRKEFSELNSKTSKSNGQKMILYISVLRVR